jgi:LmbE family N-acetylglucosaminyl deacetylase
MDFIYLSPHLDDAAFSCGGLIWEQIQHGINLEVWNIFAGNPPPGEFSLYAQVHHKIWELDAEEAIASRRNEDAASMNILGAKARHFNFPDAIYRKHPKTGEPMYTSREDLFGGINAGDEVIVHRLSILLADALQKDCTLIAPLTVGNHVDHQIVRAAASLLPFQPWFYPEYPYTKEFSSVIPYLVPRGYRALANSVSQLGLAAWQKSIAAYKSQISSFWYSLDEMCKDVKLHSEQFNGVTLWQPDTSY